MIRYLLMLAVAVSMFFLPIHTLADNTPYGSGTYSGCLYQTCAVSLGTSGTVSLNITPGSGTICTTQKDVVTVTTDSTTGYNLTMKDSTTDSSLTGSAGSVATSSATSSSPTTLVTNTWGYRVDGVDGFGPGPTIASSNASGASGTFAGVPTSAGTAATLATSASPASAGVTTNVWYGACVDTSKTAGSYSTVVTYTAVIN